MKKNCFALATTLFCSFLFVACGNQKSKSNWMADDDVRVAIDETFQPIMDNMVQTFGMANVEANMKPVYVSEDSALRMIVNDSIRCCIATRKLNDREKTVVKGHNLGVKARLSLQPMPLPLL